MEVAGLINESVADSSWIKDPQVKSKVDMVIKTLGSLYGPDETVDGETLQFILQALGMDEQMKKQLSHSKFDGDLETDYASESINEARSNIMTSWKTGADVSDTVMADMEDFLEMIYKEGNYDTMDDLYNTLKVLSGLAKDYMKHMR